MRAIGAVPVLVTSLSRRTYKDGVLVEDLTPYVEAAKKVVASGRSVIVLIPEIALTSQLIAEFSHHIAFEIILWPRGLAADIGIARLRKGCPTARQLLRYSAIAAIVFVGHREPVG